MITHLFARLVWHDQAGGGHLCDHPSENAYCIVQEHIRDGRDDGRVITSEDGLDGGIDAAAIDRIACTKILLED